MAVVESRASRVEAAVHNEELEGLHVSQQTRADADSYVAGEINSDELVERVRARYGLV